MTPSRRGPETRSLRPGQRPLAAITSDLAAFGAALKQILATVGHIPASDSAVEGAQPG